MNPVHHHKMVVRFEVAEENEFSSLAEEITDVSTSIIEENGLRSSWQTSSVYRSKMLEWIVSHDFPFTVDVIRAVEIEDLKISLYRILDTFHSVKFQFDKATFEDGQKITLIQISDFGGISTNRMRYRSHSIRDYAQYKDAVKLVGRPERKRSDYYIWLYRDCLIYDGWHEIPESVLFEVVQTSNPSIRMTRGKFPSCSNEQYTAVMDYFSTLGLSPIVNTVK